MKKLSAGILPATFKKESEEVFQKRVMLFKKQLTNQLRLLLYNVDLKQDLSHLHLWMNLPYSKGFWDMPYSQKELNNYYSHACSRGKLIALSIFIDEQPVGFVELVPGVLEPIFTKSGLSNDSLALHLLMAPPRLLLAKADIPKNITLLTVRMVLEYIFSYLPIQTVFLEPDIRNAAAHKVAVKTGFTDKGDFQLASKNCKLYTQSKEEFLKFKNDRL